jgi:hypothetical protein
VCQGSRDGLAIQQNGKALECEVSLATVCNPTELFTLQSKYGSTEINCLPSLSFSQFGSLRDNQENKAACIGPASARAVHWFDLPWSLNRLSLI